MDKIFIYLTSLSSNVAYLIVFGILLACGLGFPLPEDIPLIASGYLIWDGTMDWISAFVVTMAGVLIGDTMLFFIGRKLGLKMLQGPKMQALFKPTKVRRTRAYFRKYGDKIVFFARFVAGFRGVAFFMAGAMKMRYARFLWLDALAALLSVPLWIAIGFWCGRLWGDEISKQMMTLNRFKDRITLGILLIIVIVIVRSILKYRKAQQIAASKRSRLKRA